MAGTKTSSGRRASMRRSSLFSVVVPFLYSIVTTMSAGTCHLLQLVILLLPPVPVSFSDYFGTSPPHSASALLLRVFPIHGLLLHCQNIVHVPRYLYFSLPLSDHIRPAPSREPRPRPTDRAFRSPHFSPSAFSPSSFRLVVYASVFWCIPVCGSLNVSIARTIPLLCSRRDVSPLSTRSDQYQVLFPRPTTVVILTTKHSIYVACYSALAFSASLQIFNVLGASCVNSVCPRGFF